MPIGIQVPSYRCRQRPPAYRRSEVWYPGARVSGSRRPTDTEVRSPPLPYPTRQRAPVQVERI